MRATVIPAPQPVLLDVEGVTEQFPVHRVYCVGRNYADHAIEMGHDPSREPPFFFQKNADNLYNGDTFPYPSASSNVHYEVELVMALAEGGAGIAVEDALSKVYGYAVGVDFTRRDLQDRAKKMSRPWEAAKAFEKSGPVSAIVPAARIGHPKIGAVWLDVNGTRRQSGDLNQMIWSPAEIIAELSSYFTLAPGDVIMTGTPAGVGAVVRGDQVACGIDGVGKLLLTVA